MCGLRSHIQQCLLANKCNFASTFPFCPTQSATHKIAHCYHVYIWSQLYASKLNWTCKKKVHTQRVSKNSIRIKVPRHIPQQNKPSTFMLCSIENSSPDLPTWICAVLWLLSFAIYIHIECIYFIYMYQGIYILLYSISYIPPFAISFHFGT